MRRSGATNAPGHHAATEKKWRGKETEPMRITAILLFCLTAVNALAQHYGIQCEDTCNHIHGLDMSHYQGDVFWETLGNNSHMNYVYFKATEGQELQDYTYKRNIDLAHRYGLKVGSYHFYHANVPQVLQLHNFMAQCRPGDQDLIPMIDIEKKPSHMSTQVFCDSLLKFLQLVEEAYHQKPLLYTGTNFYNHFLQGRVDDYKLMIAQYSDREPQLADDRDYIIWQYTGKGRINGVNTYVDKSRIMGNHSMRELKFKRW